MIADADSPRFIAIGRDSERFGSPQENRAGRPADRYRVSMDGESDPVIEVYKRDVDRGLLREALKLTPEQRILELVALVRLSDELKGGLERAREDDT